MPMSTDRIPLSALAVELRRLNPAAFHHPTYRELYTAVVDCRIPAERGDNGRWTVARDDLYVIATTLRPSWIAPGTAALGASH